MSRVGGGEVSTACAVRVASSPCPASGEVRITAGVNGGLGVASRAVCSELLWVEEGSTGKRSGDVSAVLGSKSAARWSTSVEATGVTRSVLAVTVPESVALSVIASGAVGGADRSPLARSPPGVSRPPSVVAGDRVAGD